MPRRAWGRGAGPFYFTMATAVVFLALTPVAMLLYPGGTPVEANTEGYRFLGNFFSDLGRTVAHNGEPNGAAAALFLVALGLAGLGLAVFFVAVVPLYRPGRVGLALGLAGAAAGVVSGLSFVGVALTPADIARAAHGWFVMMAFRTFLIATLFHTAAVVATAHYPNRYAAVYGLFALLLAAYLWLLFRGPGLGSAQGVMIQVTGQKVIAYAAIVTALIGAWGATRVRERGG